VKFDASREERRPVARKRLRPDGPQEPLGRFKVGRIPMLVSRKISEGEAELLRVVLDFPAAWIVQQETGGGGQSSSTRILPVWTCHAYWSGFNIAHGRSRATLERLSTGSDHNVQIALI